MAIQQPKIQLVRPNRWRVLETWECCGWIVPAGFETDLDTIPRLGLVYTLLKGRTVAGAVLHDYLLRCGMDPWQADTIFGRVMREEGVPAIYRLPILAGVRLWHLWPGGKHHRKKRT